MDELDTRLVPIEPIEVSYARNRDPGERPPIPKPGDQVWYRHQTWDADVTRATVLWVQPLDDQTDPMLWHLVRGAEGQPIFDGREPRMVPVADPWPLILLKTVYGMVRTRESRVRGSAGWLPDNWRKRPVRLPHEILLRSLAPLNVP